MPATPESKIALIGLGNAGQALLQALSRTYEIQVYDRDPDRVRNLPSICQRPPIVAASAAEVARDAELVILSLPTPAASLSVA